MSRTAGGTPPWTRRIGRVPGPAQPSWRGALRRSREVRAALHDLDSEDCFHHVEEIMDVLS